MKQNNKVANGLELCNTQGVAILTMHASTQIAIMYVLEHAEISTLMNIDFAHPST